MHAPGRKERIKCEAFFGGGGGSKLVDLFMLLYVLAVLYIPFLLLLLLLVVAEFCLFCIWCCLWEACIYGRTCSVIRADVAFGWGCR